MKPGIEQIKQVAETFKGEYGIFRPWPHQPCIPRMGRRRRYRNRARRNQRRDGKRPTRSACTAATATMLATLART